MKKIKFNIALFIKKDKPYINKVIKILKTKGSLDIYFTHDKQIPLKAINKKYDIIINYLGSWIIPKKNLNQTKFININFHPGPPEYPGTGCYNFALYNNEKNHHQSIILRISYNNLKKNHIFIRKM